MQPAKGALLRPTTLPPPPPPPPPSLRQGNMRTGPIRVPGNAEHAASPGHKAAGGSHPILHETLSPERSRGPDSTPTSKTPRRSAPSDWTTRCNGLAPPPPSARPSLRACTPPPAPGKQRLCCCSRFSAWRHPPRKKPRIESQRSGRRAPATQDKTVIGGMDTTEHRRLSDSTNPDIPQPWFTGGGGEGGGGRTPKHLPDSPNPGLTGLYSQPRGESTAGSGKNHAVVSRCAGCTSS